MNNSLNTAGANISYRVVGTGPALFLVGAPAGMAGFAALAAHLSSAFKVVTHDPRGIGESALKEGARVDAESLAGDLHKLIAAVGDGPALVFGSSGGAVTGLELLGRHAGDVALLIAHEPPVFLLLDDKSVMERAEALFDLAETDPSGAFENFLNLTEITHETFEGSARPAPIKLPPLADAELVKNKFFLTRMAPASVRYRPDLDTVRAGAVVVCAGEASIGQPAREAADALANALGRPLLDAPGNHTGPFTKPEPFAAWLSHVIATRRGGR